MENKTKKNYFAVFLVLVMWSVPIFSLYNIKHELPKDTKEGSLLLADEIIAGYLVPGISGPITLDQVIKIGHLNDMDHESGVQSEEGALLAAKEINEAGGVVIDGFQRYVGLVSEDTGEFNEAYNETQVEAAAQAMVDVHDADFVIGGNVFAAIVACREKLMDAEKIFMSTGDKGVSSLLADYARDPERYQYYFKLMPMNETDFATQIIANLLVMTAILNGTYQNHNVKDITILIDDYNWTIAFADAIQNNFQMYLPEVAVNIVDIIYPATQAKMTAIMSSIESNGTDIVVPIFEREDVGAFMAAAYEDLQPNYLLAGFRSEMCEYEIGYRCLLNTNLTVKTKPFWNAFVGEFGHDPNYCAVGAYDAVYMLVNASVAADSLNSSEVVPYLEGFNSTSPFTGASGLFAFSDYHGTLAGYPFQTALACQRQEGSKIVLPPFNPASYPITLATGSLKLPPWLLEAWDYVTVGGYVVPGISGPITPDQVIKIGHLNDMDHDSGILSEEGALLAAREINEAGGVVIDGMQRYVGLVSEDTGELDEIYNETQAEAAAQAMVDVYDADFVIGGNLFAAIVACREILMDAQKIFVSTGGNGVVNLLADYIADPDRYQYYFKLMPMNETEFAGQIIANLLYMTANLNATYQNHDVKDVTILRDDYYWTFLLADAIQYYYQTYLPEVAVDIVNIAYPVTEAEMTAIMSSIESNGTDIVVPIFEREDVGALMASTYTDLQPTYLLAGLSPEACEYQIGFEHFLNTNLTTKTKPFWNAFVGEFGHSPDYCAVGAYDAVYMLVNASVAADSLNSSEVVPYLEGFNSTSPFTGASGQLAFSEYHATLAEYPFLTTLVCQWQEGTNVVIPSFNPASYPSSLATGSLMLPPWLLEAWEMDTALPGDLNLDSTADAPIDNDGAFELFWTDSLGADNYSIYTDDTPIVDLGEAYEIVPYLNSTSHAISSLASGDYYFVVVAHNTHGQTLSNNIHVVVGLIPGSFILSSDAEFPVDTDGAFNLTWTSSFDSDNYSVYISDSPIVDIDEELIAIHDVASPLSISSLPDGDYYFVVVSHNRYGQTTSNSIHVEVNLSEESTIGSPISIIGAVASLLGVGAILLRLTRKKIAHRKNVMK